MTTEFIQNDGGRSKYFKGNAGDCTVRALATLLQEDYKKIYNSFCSINHKSPRNGADPSDVYKAHGLIYEDVLGSFDDYDYENIEFDYIADYGTHLHAVIENTIHDTHGKYDLYETKGIWVKKQDEDKMLRFLYPQDYKN